MVIYQVMPLIAAIDQGTTSTRCIIFDGNRLLASAQLEHRQLFPRPGWVEHDPTEIWNNTQKVVSQAMANRAIHPTDIAAIGITNQRETTIAWDLRTGRPFHNAIVWQDNRTQSICDELAADGAANRFRAKTGLPLATYFSASKMRWLLENVPQLRAAADEGYAAMGTMDTWLIWNLSGGPHGGRLVTDVTNASRTCLMNLQALQWDDELLQAFKVPRRVLAQIVPSSHPEALGQTDPAGPFGASIPVRGCLGDQQAALVGQACFNPGDVKNTYGTGCFMLMNVGQDMPLSKAGLLTTVGYQFEGQRPVYALEGSVAIAGALVQWLRDNLGLVGSSAQIEALARQCPDNGGVYFVPAFTGLFAPWWRSDARGILVGLTQFTNRAHIARAALEAVAFQTRDVLAAMAADVGTSSQALKVDGGMTVNELLMQFQADVLAMEVHRSAIGQSTAYGAACAAGLASGCWANTAQIQAAWNADRSWTPTMDEQRVGELCRQWRRAIERSMGWMQPQASIPP